MSSNYSRLDTQSDPFADDAHFQIDDNDDDDINLNISPDTFQSASAPALASTSPTPSPAPASYSIPQPKLKKTYEGGLISLNYYRQYFDLNTAQFFKNCISSMNPISKPSADEFNEVGDLYGSVWITASLIFLLFFCNSFASLLSGWFLGIDLQTLNINYFKMIVSSINLLYGYSILTPLVLYLLLKFYYKTLFLVPLTKLISIYSYANLLWTPAVLLSIFRGLLVNHNTLDAVLKWSCILVGALMSGCSIIYKLKVYFSSIFGEEDKKSMYILLALLTLAHLGFTLGVKFCFFGKL